MSSVQPKSQPSPIPEKVIPYPVVLAGTSIGCLFDVIGSTPAMAALPNVSEGKYPNFRKYVSAIVTGKLPLSKVYNGATANYLGYAPNLALAMTGQAYLERRFEDSKIPPLARTFLAANIAGAGASSLFVGVERLMLTQQVVDPKNPMKISFSQALKKIQTTDKKYYEQKGYNGLSLSTLVFKRAVTLGMTPMLLRDCGYISLFPLANYFKDQMPNQFAKDHPFWAHLAVAGPMGCLGGFATMPFVSVKTRMQVQGLSLSEAIHSLYKEGGWPRLFKGSTTRMLSLTSGVFWVYVGSTLSEKPLLLFYDFVNKPKPLKND